jgi:uncharacterized protein
VQVIETIFGFGHENILSTHHSTLEFTKDAYVSNNGDCILVVSADKAPIDLGSAFKENLQKPGAKLTIIIEVDDLKEQIQAYGHPHLTLTHPTEMVIRKSDYLSDRTLGVRADKAANELSRALVDKLKNPQQKVKITLKVLV